jgi:type I site-specific restriction endonuclease
MDLLLSITLYHQMVGRGARRLASKKTFGITDLGNNIQRLKACGKHWTGNTF